MIDARKGVFIKRMQSFVQSKTIMHGTLFSLFSFINRGFVFLLLLILANFISPNEYGYLSLFSTVVTILDFFICLSCEGYMSVAFFQEGIASVKYVFSTILYVGLLMTAIFLIIFYIGGTSLSILLNLPLHILFLAVFTSLFTVLANVNLNFFRLEERVGLYGLFSCGNALLNFIVSILMVQTFLFGWYGRAYAQAGCATLFGLFCIYFFLRKKCLTIHFKDYLRPMLFWSLPLIPLHAANFVRQGLDRYIINYSHTVADVGLFSFALNIANIITMIGFGFNQSFSVDIYKILGDNLTKREKLVKLKKLIRMILFVFIFAACIVSVICYFLIPLMLPKYAQSMNYFALLSIYAFFVCYYLAYTNILYYFDNTKNIMYWSVGSSVFHMLLSLFLTRYSLYLTCIIYCVSQCIFALGIHWQANHVLRKQLVQ